MHGSSGTNSKTGMSKREVLAQFRAWVDDDEPMYEPMDEIDDAPMEDTTMEDATMEDATSYALMQDISMEDTSMEDAPMEDITIQDVPIQALNKMTYISRKRSLDENVTMVPTSSPRSRSKRSRPSNMEQWTALDNMCKRMGALRLT